MQLVMMNLAVVFLFTFFVFSTQDPQLRSLLSSSALGPSKSAFFIFSSNNFTSNTNEETTAADAADNTTTQKYSEEEPEVSDRAKTTTNPITKESKPMMRSDGEISLTMVLLKDIRDALYEKTEDLEQEFKENVKYRLDSLSLEVQESVNAVTADLERVRESMEQKVELMLETFSTLRMLVVGQGQQLDELQERLQGVEEEVEQLKQTKAPMQQQPSSNYRNQDDTNNPGSRVRGKRNPETNNRDTDLNKTVRNTTVKLENLKQQVQNVTEEVFWVKDELQNLQTNVTSLSLVSSTTTPLKKSMTVTPSSISCQCSTEVLQSTIEKLEAAQKKQKNDFVEMKRRISVVESFRSGVGSYSQRLGVAENPREDLEEVKTTVAAVQDDLNKLKEGMEGAVTSNGTFFAKASGKGERDRERKRERERDTHRGSLSLPLL